MSRLLEILGLKELEVSKKDEFNKYALEFKENNYQHIGCYILNFTKIAIGIEPSKISPENKFVNSYFNYPPKK